MKKNRNLASAPNIAFFQISRDSNFASSAFQVFLSEVAVSRAKENSRAVQLGAEARPTGRTAAKM